MVTIFFFANKNQPFHNDGKPHAVHTLARDSVHNVMAAVSRFASRSSAPRLQTDVAILGKTLYAALVTSLSNMKTHFRPVLLCLFAFSIAAACRAEGPYHLIKEIPVGGDGGWDYVSVDSDAGRLYVSHGTKVVVIDLKKNEVVGEIADTPGIHGFAIAPELGRGFSSNGREGKASIADLKTLKTLSKVETGENPDAILYEPVQKEVYTFNGRGRSATVFR